MFVGLRARRIVSVFLLVCIAGLVSACQLAASASRALSDPAASANHPIVLQPPLGLPPVPVPRDDPITLEKVALGKKLFMDRRLSHNNTQSCAMCHVPEQGFTSNEVKTAVGFEGRSLRRNAPTLYNVAYIQQLFHDGREFSLENQVIGPMTHPDEMSNPSMGYVIEKIKIMPDYDGLFERAFDGQGPNVQNIGQALSAYERSILSANSAFDRWRYGHEKTAMTDQQIRGFQLFVGKGGCSACHLIGEKDAVFTDNRFYNSGIGWRRSMNNYTPKHRVELAPGTYVEVDDAIVSAFDQPGQGDVGRYEVTSNPADRWAYRTPSLRNVALTSPYMHDGSIPTLEAVIEFYNQGGIDNENKAPQIKPLHLSAEEKSDLVAFLHALTGDNIQALTKSARMAPTDSPIPAEDAASEYRGAPR